MKVDFRNYVASWLPGDLGRYNGTVTIQSPRAGGEHRTFRIRTQRQDAAFAPGRRIVALLTGANNDEDYEGFGFLPEDGSDRVDVWRSRRGGVAGKSSWEWYAEMLSCPDLYVARGYRYLVSRCCRRCNRKLTTPGSVEAGIGPECAGRVA